MHKRILIFILLIILVSGCDKPEEPEDILQVDTLEALPSDTVSPGTDMVIRMRLRNTGTSDVWLLTDKDAKDAPEKYDGDMILVNYCPGVYILQADPFRITTLKEKPCDTPPDEYSADLGDSADLENACYLHLSPGDIHEFEWNLKAPANTQGLSQECTLDFASITASTAKTISYIYFASPNELEYRHSEDSPPLEPISNSAPGPLTISFSPAGKEPLAAGEPWTAYIKGENTGTGTATINNIQLESTGFDAGECNANSFDIYAQTTPTISCVLNAPTDVEVIRPYRIEISAAYTYIQQNSLDITTDPNL